VNIFIIPSWYPTKESPVAGIFFKEQASYLAEYSSCNTVGVSLWGQSNDLLLWRVKDLLLPKKIMNKFSYGLNQKKKIINVAFNLFEFYCPVITWSERLLKGNFNGVLEANNYNFEKFVEKVGKVDLIHAHVSYPAGFIAMCLAQKYNIPYIITEHMGPFPFPGLLNKDNSLLDKVFKPLNKAHKIIAVSPSLAEKIKSFNLPEPIFIPNVINEDFFNVSEKQQQNSRFTFFCLCAIEPTKGIPELLYATKRLILNGRSSFIVKIGGDGRFLPDFKQLATKLNINDYITWLGQLDRNEARQHYQDCDAFVLPSHFETFGVVYAEAIACGKPIIGTYAGGPECIINEVNGLLVKVRDINDLTSKMDYMIENIKHYKSQDIRSDFERRFSKKVVIPELLNLYNKVINI